MLEHPEHPPGYATEYKYMKNLVKDNLQAALKFNGTMRYIDDLLTLNNSGFVSKIPAIYLSS